jgi:hypothetical protein
MLYCSRPLLSDTVNRTPIQINNRFIWNKKQQQNVQCSHCTKNHFKSVTGH